MDRQRMLPCPQQVAAYQTSGPKANEWTQANGVSLRSLSSWCAHARRRQAQLDGVSYESAAARKPAGGGFVATGVGAVAPAPMATLGCVRLELQLGATRVQLHWPLAHMRELAACLRELGR